MATAENAGGKEQSSGPVVPIKGDHVLFVTNSLITSDHPSKGGTWLLTQTKAYLERGWKVGILCVMQRSGSRLRKRLFHGPWLSRTVVHGAAPAYCDYGWRLLWDRKYTARLAFRVYPAASLRLFLAYIARHGRPDIIHVHCSKHAILAGRLFSEWASRPMFVTEHQFIHRHRFVNPRVGREIKAALRKARGVIAVSPMLRDELAQWAGLPSDKMAAIPNMVDEDFFTVAPFPQTDEFRFVAVGTLDANKNQAMLVRAMALTSERYPFVRATIVGSGPKLQELRRLAGELGVEDRVTFTGPLERDEVRRCIWDSHVVVSTSHQETFAMPLTEGLACGRPVLATASGGPQSIVTAEIGRLVPVGCTEELARGMEDMIANHGRYRPERLREYAVAHFGTQAVMDKLSAHYELCCG